MMATCITPAWKSSLGLDARRAWPNLQRGAYNAEVHLSGAIVKRPSLSRLLDKKDAHPEKRIARYGKRLERLQLEMLRIQQGLFHAKERAIVALEGFDAAGKGGSIRRLTEHLDPRGFKVVPIGPPKPDEQGRHYLYRFWKELPPPGQMTVFDRTWYGRVLVERVEKLCPKPAWKRAYQEINEFERMLVDDGVDLVKIFLAVSKKEQLKRFEERLSDPYKHWKIGEADVQARGHWKDYVAAVDEMFERTSTQRAPWHVVLADNKESARLAVLELVTKKLRHHRKWIEDRAERRERKDLQSELAKLR
jgi:polyphosphate kinase 2 (PPK2 family)